MAEDNELKLEEEAQGGNKMMIIIIAVVVVVIGAAAAFFLMGGEEEAADEEVTEQVAIEQVSAPAEVGTAMYVTMPRPFVFNVPGSTRDRLVQIRVQLMVRGEDNDELAKRHIPLIEGTLLKAFSSANADDLTTTPGKDALKEKAAQDVQKALMDTLGKQVVEEVLFTGFVMQ